MQAFDERLPARSATIDELLSDRFEPLPGRKDGAELAARRLAAWCRACANGDWAIFARRLERDRLAFAEVLPRLATVRPSMPPGWVADASWIEAALQAGPGQGSAHFKLPAEPVGEPCAFEDLLLPAVERAEAVLWEDAGERAGDQLLPSAQESLRRILLRTLSDLTAAPLYERFAKLRDSGAGSYERFVSGMRTGEFRQLFEEKPVLLRLIAVLTRQWIDASREFALRLSADLDALSRQWLSADHGRVEKIEGGLADRHNDGRSVLILTFESGDRLVYKPKDLRLDAAWQALIARLNSAGAPLELRAVRALARDGYGWTEFIEHKGCDDLAGCERFYRRAGAWLALFHCFAATDMHQENIIATGEHPVPIDLETLLQSASASKAQEQEGAAYHAAADIIANSVARVGMLPAFGRGPDNTVFGMGGLTSGWNSRIEIAWNAINRDEMRPTKVRVDDNTNPNLPHVGGSYVKFGDYFDAFAAGFRDYSDFLVRQVQERGEDALLQGFAGVPVRRVVRPTRFYSMLLQRLKSPKSMDDGAIWSAEADFVARLADWEQAADPNWPLHRAERAALLTLNVPHFVLPSDGHEIHDNSGVVAKSQGTTGLDRARARLRGFDAKEIAWQVEVIRANAEPSKPLRAATASDLPEPVGISAAAAVKMFASEADRVAGELSERAVRRPGSAAWIGLDWLGDAEAFQLVCLGPDLYNGVTGIGVFLAAHAKVTGKESSAALALDAVSLVRSRLKDRNAQRFARLLGIGGAAGLGSILYGLAAMSKSLRDESLLADAYAVSRFITEDLIAADKRLDVISGSAGAILCLLRLYRDTQADDVLQRAVSCGEHLLRQNRVGPDGRRSWVGLGFGTEGLNGMSHGASGFAYALASLTAATGREEFETAAAECLAFENSSFDPQRSNWPDLRPGNQGEWPCQWCHGATGIGVARTGLMKRGAMDQALLQADIDKALAGAESGWRGKVDTLCCGALGSVEFFCEAADVLERPDLRELAAIRLAAVVQAAGAAGDYRWNSGKERFNLGLFRGMAGVGYTMLRRIDRSLPNVLIWE